MLSKEGFCKALQLIKEQETIEDYNLDKVEPDWWALKGLAASLLPVIQEFYTHEENIRAFEEWLQERET